MQEPIAEPNKPISLAMPVTEAPTPAPVVQMTPAEPKMQTTMPLPWQPVRELSVNEFIEKDFMDVTA